MHLRHAARIGNVKKKIAIRNCIKRVLRHARKAQELCRVRAIEWIRGTCQCGTAKNQNIAGLKSSHHALEVTRKHLRVRKHVMREKHWLSFLHVSITGHNNIIVCRRTRNKRGSQFVDIFRKLHAAAFTEQTRISSHLIITRTTCMQARAGRTYELGQLFLNRHMYVLIGDIPREFALFNKMGNLPQTLNYRIDIFRRKDSYFSQHFRMRNRTFNVFTPHALINRK